MTKDELTKVRDALSEGCGWSEQLLANYDEKYARHPATEAYREFITDSQNKIIEALDILDRALAAPEQEPDPSVYNLKRIGWELERTAMGDGYYGNALYAAKEIPGLTSKDRSLLDRYMTGGEMKTDHVALQDLAMRIYKMEPPAPQSAQPVSLETVYETIIAWDIAGKRSRRELARRMIELFTAPPSRKWQGLTDRELGTAMDKTEADCPYAKHQFGYFLHLYKEIDAALRAKNSGEQNG